jgi:hypothetical protein
MRRITEFVKEFWDVFYEDGVKSPIIGYELVIDTGNHRPIAVKNRIMVYTKSRSWRRPSNDS